MKAMIIAGSYRLTLWKYTYPVIYTVIMWALGLTALTVVGLTVSALVAWWLW
jgi:hypothetical protein